MQQLVILLVINFSSTCFGRLYVCVHTARHPIRQHHNSYNRRENHRQCNVVWPPDDGHKDARNMLRDNWLPINHHLLHLVGLAFICLSKMHGQSSVTFYYSTWSSRVLRQWHCILLYCRIWDFGGTCCLHLQVPQNFSSKWGVADCSEILVDAYRTTHRLILEDSQLWLCWSLSLLPSRSTQRHHLFRSQRPVHGTQIIRRMSLGCTFLSTS